MKSRHTNYRIVLRIAASLAAGICTSSYATASLALGTVEQRLACTPDVFRLCSSEIPNVEQIISCMKAKRPSLSQACRSVFNPPASRD
ncbi:MAG: hypothetical protein L0Y57_04270 [Beijerinckiaceae bacterium]|nr:hypothetical protein [Beijerinckiaceae bacterium]